ncbi:MAG: TetR family transcriptional regulator [Xanthomonadaceae bacterium]|nr:TetR family transcriptional regulator [Xanthomonadaceae bacterium]
MVIKRKEVRRNKIITKALEIFAKKGFQETTIAEISKASGVSEATVYEYFNSKEELLFAIPEDITRESVEEFKQILPFLKGAEHKVRAIVLGYLTLYQNNPQYSALVLLQLKNNKKFQQTRAYELIRDIARLLLDCIKEGIDEGVFKKDLDPYLIRSMLLGTIEHLCIRWHLLGVPDHIVDYVDPIIDLMMDGMKARDHEKKLSINLYVSDGKMVSAETADENGA